MSGSVTLVAYGALATFLLTSCSADPEASSNQTSSSYVEPDWRKFRSVAVGEPPIEQRQGYKPIDGKFVFADIKYEDDDSLARRLLGALAENIVYIDRQKDQWKYYEDDSEPIRSINLFSKPQWWGSAFGICRAEKYEITFTDEGQISTVTVLPRYGVEGPIFQKGDFDWEHYHGAMCESVAPEKTPSYFLAGESVLDAQDLAILLSLAIDEASRGNPLTYELNCQSFNGESCQNSIRRYLGALRLHDIKSVSQLDCVRPTEAGQQCFTVKVGSGTGPFPKYITVKGSTYMNDWQVHSVDVLESFTMS